METDFCLGLFKDENKLPGEHGKGNSWKSQGGHCREGDLRVSVEGWRLYLAKREVACSWNGGWWAWLD